MDIHLEVVNLLAKKNLEKLLLLEEKEEGGGRRQGGLYRDVERFKLLLVCGKITSPK